MYGIKEAKGTNQLERCIEDLTETQRILQKYFEVNLGEEHTGKVICMEKILWNHEEANIYINLNIRKDEGTISKLTQTEENS